MTKLKRVLCSVILPVMIVTGLACSHAKKKTPELSTLLGKKVALVEVTGEDTARRVARVALVNQLTERGTFYLISDEDVEAARAQYQTDPSNWKGIAQKAGADYALIAHVLEFKSDIHTGYSRETVEDSQMEAETGDAKTEHLYKVKSLTGTVRIELQFADLKTGDVRQGITEKTDTVTGDERKGGIDLPPRLRFLEGLANDAFKEFFSKYD